MAPEGIMSGRDSVDQPVGGLDCTRVVLPNQWSFLEMGTVSCGNDASSLAAYRKLMLVAPTLRGESREY